jgi:hypothetical protein
MIFSSPVELDFFADRSPAPSTQSISSPSHFQKTEALRKQKEKKREIAMEISSRLKLSPKPLCSHLPLAARPPLHTETRSPRLSAAAAAAALGRPSPP